MEMHQIRYFLAVCSQRNFTRASKFSRVSQPSLTRAIKLLEKEFGGPLFRREGANSPLTELGEIVRPHLREIWEQSHSAKAHAHEFMSVSSSRLGVGIMCTIEPALLTNLFTRARSRHEAIALEIVDGTAHDLEEQLLAGRIGAAIYAKPEADIDARFNKIPLFREQLLIAISRKHPLANRAAIGIAGLAGEQYIRRHRCEFGDLFGALLKQHRIECRTSFSSERDDWALALIGSGFGFGLLPHHAIRRPDVVARPLAEHEIWREVSLATLRGRPHNKALGALVAEAMLDKPAIGSGPEKPRK
jgi:LysR family transcriptional regulator, hydrogen peroxide-inducible genes activator